MVINNPLKTIFHSVSISASVLSCKGFENINKICCQTLFHKNKRIPMTRSYLNFDALKTQLINVNDKEHNVLNENINSIVIHSPIKYQMNEEIHLKEEWRRNKSKKRKLLKQQDYNLYHFIWKPILEQYLSDHYAFQYNKISFSTLRKELILLYNWKDNHSSIVINPQMKYSKLNEINVNQANISNVSNIGYMDNIDTDSSYSNCNNDNQLQLPSYFLHLNLLKTLSRQICDQYNIIHPYDKKLVLFERFDAINIEKQNEVTKSSDIETIESNSKTIPIISKLSSNIILDLSLEFNLSKEKIRSLFYSWFDQRENVLYNSSELESIISKIKVSLKEQESILIQSKSILRKLLKKEYKLNHSQLQIVLDKLKSSLVNKSKLTKSKKQLIIQYANNFKLNPYHINELIESTSLSRVQIKRVLNYLKENQTSKIDSIVRNEILNYLSNINFRKLTFEEFDVLSNKYSDISRYALHFLIKNIRYQKIYSSTKQLLLDQGKLDEIKIWILNNKNENNKLNKESIIEMSNKFNITIDQSKILFHRLIQKNGNITEEKKNIIRNWIQNYGKNSLDLDSIASLGKKTLLSNQQIRDIIRNIREKNVNHSHSEIIKQWVNNHNNELPSNDQYNEWIQETGLTREQLRKMVYYWRHPPQKLTIDKKKMIEEWFTQYKNNIKNQSTYSSSLNLSEETMKQLSKEMGINKSQLRKQILKIHNQYQNSNQ